MPGALRTSSPAYSSSTRVPFGAGTFLRTYNNDCRIRRLYDLASLPSNRLSTRLPPSSPAPQDSTTRRFQSSTAIVTEFDVEASFGEPLRSPATFKPTDLIDVVICVTINEQSSKVINISHMSILCPGRFFNTDTIAHRSLDYRNRVRQSQPQQLEAIHHNQLQPRHALEVACQYGKIHPDVYLRIRRLIPE